MFLFIFQHREDSRNKKDDKMGNHDCVPCNFILNIFTAIVLVVVFVVLEVYPIVPAFHRGFYCNDDTINKPYLEKETISTSTLIVTSVLLVIILATICELTKRCRKTAPTQPQNVVLIRRKFPAWICRLLSRISLIIIGLLMTLIVVDIGKKLIGRLRPHFLTVCQPDTNLYNCTDGYITADVCTNPDIAVVAEARLSFPSGHAAMSAFVAVVLALYIEYTVKVGSLFKPLVQYMLLCVGLAGALSRIPDYYHHWSDVLVGLFIGVAHALYTVFYLLKLQDEKKVDNKVESTTTTNMNTANPAPQGVVKNTTNCENANFDVV